jgi:hypothetical protein
LLSEIIQAGQMDGGAYLGIKHKVLRSYSQALPIHAKTGREWGPENAYSFYGSQDDRILDTE